MFVNVFNNDEKVEEIILTMKKTLSAFSVSAAALSLVLAEGVQADQLVDNQSYSMRPLVKANHRQKTHKRMNLFRKNR